MTLHNEDKELQIRLAELQADIQINLTLCFGFVAIDFAIIIGLQQIYFISPDIIVKNSTLGSMLGCLILILFVVRHYSRKIVDARKQMKELKKQYVW